MPRDLSGNYTLPEGNPVAGGTVIDVEWANPTMEDIAQQLNNVFTRDGLLGPLAPWKLVDGTVVAPAMTFNSELGMGLYRQEQNIMGLAINGAAVAKWSTTGMDVIGGIARNGTAIAEVPTGTILDFAGVTPPSGYLVCNGQTVSRTTYAALFAVLGGTWGGGDGSTTFHLPDLRRRVAVGSGGTAVSGPGATIGNIGGEEATVLDNGTLPSHSHGIVDQIHAHLVAVSGNTGTVSNDHQHYVSVGGGGHEHVYDMKYITGGSASGGDLKNLGITQFATTGGGAHSHEGWSGGISANHTHSWSGTFASDNRYTGINGTQASGGSAAHNTMQPSAVVNKIIKF